MDATAVDGLVNMDGTTQPGDTANEIDASKFVNDIEIEEDEGENLKLEEQYWKYLPLHSAALRGDWNSAKRIFDEDKDALTATITVNLETTLHVAIATGNTTHFVDKLVELMPMAALEERDQHGDTALSVAAFVGNTRAAVILVKKHPALLYIRNNVDWLPIHLAAYNAHKDTLSYLLNVCKDDPESMPFAYQSGVQLLLFVIASGFYDVALNLVHKYPKLATSKLYEEDDYALLAMAKKVSAFHSGCRLKSWKSIIYSYVPVKLDNCASDHNSSDIENPVNSSQVIVHKCDWAQHFLQKFSISVPYIKHIREQKLMHHQALQLVKLLCKEIRSLKDLKAYTALAKGPLLQAAFLGIREIVEEIVYSFPRAIWDSDSQNRYIFQWAVINRHENVFNLLYQMGDYKQYMTRVIDDYGNTILHLAARLAPPDKLNLVPGAALQMQRELQWFKEVESFVNPTFTEYQNDDEQTPSEVFTIRHANLLTDGEEWMKNTANSCTIAAALITTIVFAAAITVPGGNDATNGLPIFAKEKVFIIFVISDAISLFASTTSLLMFLSILTSCYAEDDFFYILPKRLIIGLVTLFLSITSMMVAFSSTLYLVLGHNKAWILIPVVALACLPITSFVSLQFPILVELIWSTYGPGIFGKKSDQPFY